MADETMPEQEYEAQENSAEANRPAAAPKERFEQAARDRQQQEDAPEETLWEGSYSHLAMIGTWAAGGVATVLAIVVGLLMHLDFQGWGILVGVIVVAWIGLGLLYLYRHWSVSYQLTNQRLLHAEGILWRTSDRVELIDVDDVTYRQGPVERIVGVGTILVTSSDRTTPELEIAGIADVRQVADQIDETRRKERRSRGLHIEAV